MACTMMSRKAVASARPTFTSTRRSARLVVRASAEEPVKQEIAGVSVPTSTPTPAPAMAAAAVAAPAPPTLFGKEIILLVFRTVPAML